LSKSIESTSSLIFCCRIFHKCVCVFLDHSQLCNPLYYFCQIGVISNGLDAIVYHFLKMSSPLQHNYNERRTSSPALNAAEISLYMTAIESPCKYSRTSVMDGSRLNSFRSLMRARIARCEPVLLMRFNQASRHCTRC
jgi:hypothetical protein